MSVSSTPAPMWRPMTPDLESTSISYAAASHPGCVRAVNEDGWLATPPVFVVADGMGGHRAGDVASAIVVDEFERLARSGNVDAATVGECLDRSRVRIAELADDDGAAPGSTVVAAVLVEENGIGYWLVANIGDSRAYSWSRRALARISRDHSVVQELLDAGEITEAEARVHPDRHVITRALGALEVSPADFSMIPVLAGASIVLCSDGVTSELTDAEIAAVLRSTSGAKDAADTLVAASLAAGGRDNVTVVVIEVDDGTTSSDQATVGDASGAEEDTVRHARSIA